MYEYAVKSVVKVVDGDTVDLLIDLGFSIMHKIRVRLYGINTPESRTRDLEEKKLGLAAKERLRELLCVDERSGYNLILSTKERGKYGRYLGILYRENLGGDNRMDINQRLITEGHAVEYFGGKRS